MTRLRAFPIVGFRSDADLHNAWNATRPETVTISLDEQGRTLVQTTSEDSVYLVLGSDDRSFNELAAGHGLDVAGGLSLVVGLEIPMRDDIRAEIHLLEYDAERHRLGATRLPARRRSLYTPGPDVAHVLLTIRLRGRGPLAIDQLLFDPVASPGNLRAGVVPLDDPTLAPEAAAVDDAGLDELASSLRGVVEAGKRASRSLSQVRSRLETVTADAVAVETSAGGSLAAKRLTRDLLVELASTLPTSNGSEYFHQKLPYHLAIVTDEYMLNFYRDAFERVTYVRPAEVEDVIADGFDLFLYVTCWKGIDAEEWRGVKFRELPQSALERLLQHTREQAIPSMFQSIEDPSNFEYFLPIAEQFDHVFTSDTDCLDRYRTELGHDRVAYAEYGANPLLNNPIGSYRHTIDRAFFAGSYPQRYPERVDDMHVLFDSILSTGENLTLIDRNFGDPDNAFPPKYAELSLQPMPHDILQRVHKLFRWSLNFNSIKSSPTMCAMRIYELQAQGRGLLSNYARSVFNRFPEIRLVAEPEDLSAYFGTPIELEELRTNETQIRSVLTGATTHDVALDLLARAGLPVPQDPGPPTVALLAGDLDAQLEAEIAAQSHHGHVQVVIRDQADPDATAQQVLATGARYVGTVEPDLTYGPHYVTDRLNAFKYTDSDFITQHSTVVGGAVDGPAHEYVDAPADGLTLFSVRKVGLEGVRALAGGQWPHASAGYSLPPFQAAPRHDPGAVSEPGLMTAQAGPLAGSSEPAGAFVGAAEQPGAVGGAARWEQPAEVPRGVSDPVLSIIVPVHNAGHFLLTKCLPSIQRNRRADEFEVLLIDDGSTDGITPQICRDLAERYPAVRAYCFEDGGSGSASRPRNKGLELARGARIAFLDPDNEISDRGYDTLLGLFEEAEAEQPGVGFVTGYQVKVSRTSTFTGRHASSRLAIISDLRTAYFERGKFPVISTQAAVIDRELFEDGALRFVERAAGQDTLFGWELLLKAGVGAFTTAAHLIYYAERDDSVTNSVDLAYFRKKLLLEQAQVEVLRRHDLLDLYVDRHFEEFYQNWYLKKLEHVDPAQRPDATEILRRIAGLYDVRVDL